MGDGLRKVAKMLGGLTVKNKDVTVTYGADGQKTSRKKRPKKPSVVQRRSSDHGKRQ